MADNTEPTIVTINEGTCEWAVLDRDGQCEPHGIKARREVSGAGEFWDGRFCVRHAVEAVERSKNGPGVLL